MLFWLFAPLPAGPAAPACAVYQALHDDFAKGGYALVFRSHAERMSSPVQLIGASAFQYSRRTGRTRTHIIEEINEPVTVPETEDAVLDASGHAIRLLLGPRARVSDCFNGREARPRFFDGGLGAIYQGAENIPIVGSTAIIAVSPVSISADGNTAILYAEQHCGALCGGGAFYVLERRDATWRVVGDKGLWVS
jgi:hypothetical protein